MSNDFWKKITTYQHYWNLGRFNSYKNNRTHLQILQEAAPRLPPEILLLAPVDLDTLVSAGVGHHVPVLPENRQPSLVIWGGVGGLNSTTHFLKTL